MATSTGLSALETTLRGALPPEAIAVATDADAVDGLVPRFVASPSDVEQVSGVLRSASDTGAAVIARGSGRHLGPGMPPGRYDVALKLSSLNRILEYSPADLTVTVEAGVLLSDLQAALGRNGQWLPLDPRGDGTVGGLLAANRSGPARIVHGAARDQVIGLQVVMADGQLIKSGGRVVKNVAGYDLAKLHIGAIGTLGVIVQASFKIAPLPAGTSSMALSGSSSSLMSTSLQIRNLGLAVNGMSLTSNGEGWQLLVTFAGGGAAVARSRHEVEVLVQRNGLSEAGSDIPGLDGAVVVRASLPPMSVQQVGEALVATGAGVLAYPTAGIVSGAWPEAPSTADLESLRRLCVTGGGAFVVESAPLELKQRFDVWGEAGADLSLMRRLKEQFDPKGMLSPGRFLGGI